MGKESGMRIYFPDALDGALLLEDLAGARSTYKDAVAIADSDISFKVKAYLGVNKTIELANIFKCVYLDKLEFFFIVKDLYHNQPKLCLDLLEAGKIGFIDSDKYFMLYKVGEAISKVQIHRVPKKNNDEFLEEFRQIGSQALTDAVKHSIELALPEKDLSPEHITDLFVDDLRRGYYQGLGVGINSIIDINDENKEIYDLLAQLTLDLLFCDIHEVEAIYLKEYFYWADHYKRSFKNSIYCERAIFQKVDCANYTFALSENCNEQMGNDELLLEAAKYKKELECTVFPNEYKSLEMALASHQESDYLGKKIVFIDKNNEHIPVSTLSPKEYLGQLQERGQARRQTRLFIKITPKKYLDGFLAGNIKFSRPIEFLGDKTLRGQGDNLEGVFKSGLVNGKRVCTRNEYDVNFNLIWCCFGLDNYMFVNSSRDGKPIRKATVKKEFYQGFLDKGSKDSNAIVFIKPDIFVKRVCEALISKGIVADDILISPIIYIRKSENFWLSCEPPYELFYKDLFYLPQNEIRILIRNSAQKYAHLFDKYGVINIGNISDICTVIDGMYDCDMECYLISGSRMEFNLPKTKSSQKKKKEDEGDDGNDC